MKLFSIFLATILALLFSCKDDALQEKGTGNCPCQLSKDVLLQNYYVAGGGSDLHEGDFVCAHKSDTCWTVPGVIEKLQNGGDTIVIFGSGMDETLTIKIGFRGLGTYQLENKNKNEFHLFGNCATYYTTIGRDVITSNYYLESPAVLVVTEYDPSKKIIAGTFEFKMYRSYSWENTGTEKLEFVNGMFCAHLPD